MSADAIDNAAALRWHPTRQEKAVCDAIWDGCPHGAEFIASLPWPEKECAS